MRIVQLLTLLSAKGASGGVGTVALQQAEGLSKGGHDVRLVAGWFGEGRPPLRHVDVPLKLPKCRSIVPGTGQRLTFGVRLAGAIVAEIRHAELVHVHACRDLTTQFAMLVCRLIRKPYVVQAHGMLGVRKAYRLYDRMLTIPNLRAAGRVLALTDGEAAAVVELVPTARIAILPNGIRAPKDVTRLADREEPPLVLFVARLEARKRPEIFVQMAAELIGQGVGARFLLMGQDEGSAEGARRLVSELGLSSKVSLLGAVTRSEVLAFLAAARLLVLPSVDEPYPMALIEALAFGTPAICTTSCGLAPLLSLTSAAAVVEPDLNSIVLAAGRILNDPTFADKLTEAGRRLVQGPLSIDAITGQLGEIYAVVQQGRLP